MILKLREAHISNLEKARQDEGFPDLETETIVSLTARLIFDMHMCYGNNRTLSGISLILCIFFVRTIFTWLNTGTLGQYHMINFEIMGINFAFDHRVMISFE